MNNDPQPADSLDPDRLYPWFEQPRGRHAFAVERAARLDALGSLNGRELVELGHDRPRLHGGRSAPGGGTFHIAVLDLPEPAR